MTIHQHILTMTSDTLRDFLRALNEKSPSLKDARAKRLHDIWKSNPQQILDALSEPEIKLLAECVHEDCTRPDVDRVNARYGFSYSIPYLGGYREQNFIHFFIFKPDRYSDYELVSGVKNTLKKYIAIPPPLSVKPSDPLETNPVYNGERIALVEAKRMLQLVSAGKLKVSEKTRLPSAACIKQVKSILCEPETEFSPERSYAWPVLIQQCGWAKPRVGKLGLTRSGKALLENFTPDGYADGVQTMLNDSVFDEMSRAPAIKGMKSKWARRCREDASIRRLCITNALAEFPAKEWIKINQAFDHVVASGNSFDVVECGGSLYIGDANYGTLDNEELGISRVYFRVLAAESFTTLGILDSANCAPDQQISSDISNCWGMECVEFVTSYDNVCHLRLTPLGAFCLGATVDYETPKAEKRTLFNVLPNHEIVVTDANAFSVGDAAQLERFSKKTSDSVWKMNKKTIFQALESGDSADDIRSVLQMGTANEIPKTVLQLIDETAEHSGAISKSEDAVAVSFRDKHTAVLVEHDAAIRPSIFCRNGSTLFVRTKNLKKFQSGLRKLGILLP